MLGRVLWKGVKMAPEEGKRWPTRLRFLSHKRSQIPVCRVQDIGVSRDDNLRLSLKSHQTAIHLASLTRCQQQKKKNVMSLLTGREAGADFLPLSLAFSELNGADADADQTGLLIAHRAKGEPLKHLGSPKSLGVPFPPL